MTTIPASRLQQAVYALLKDNKALSARLQGIHDEPPHDGSLPYLSLGDTRLTENSVKDRRGMTISLEVNLWTGGHSQMEVKDLVALADEALTGMVPDVPGFSLLPLMLKGVSFVRQFGENGSLYRGRLAYDAIVFEADWEA